MTVTITALQKQRRDTASNWTLNNTVLLAGEFGYETDTKRIKIGDGASFTIICIMFMIQLHQLKKE